MLKHPMDTLGAISIVLFVHLFAVGQGSQTLRYGEMDVERCTETGMISARQPITGPLGFVVGCDKCGSIRIGKQHSRHGFVESIADSDVFGGPNRERIIPEHGDLLSVITTVEWFTSFVGDLDI